MNFDFTGLSVIANGETAEKAADIFCDEIESRTGVRPLLNNEQGKAEVCFVIDETIDNKDCFKIAQEETTFTVSAKTIRGLIFGMGQFLRKSEYDGEKITLIKDLSGNYTPDMRIRGHQLGYRTTTNCYDAWDLNDYRRYYLDLMFFGCNTCEHIPYEKGTSDRNRLMKYDEEEFLFEASALADELDMDVSVWFPNNDDTVEETVARRKKFFERIPRINALFIPGGDPGEFPGDEFVDRIIEISKALKEVHPEAEMWPSAQAPHSQINWGNDFIEKMEQLPDEIDGVIMGPNHAFPLEVLRRKLPDKYPIRLYPDITHNVRCEYPVHYPHDDWHYATTTGLSRESINPRPTEFRNLHRMTRNYLVGSVSYSEGVNDDINKMVWSDMDFDGDVSLSDTLTDYSRLFFPGLPAEKVKDAILGLENNWVGDPAENDGIEDVLAKWQALYTLNPKLSENWRFVSCLFRAQCDALVRRRRIFENALVDEAKYLVAQNKADEARKVLETDFEDSYKALHDEVWANADKLFNLIGLQLDVEHYCANSWERGATLETIDLPVTDRPWLINRLNFAETLDEKERAEFFEGLLNRNKVDKDEMYFSLAEHGFEVLGTTQGGEVYVDFQGDKPFINNGTIPMCMLKIFDFYSLRAKLGGFTADSDYELKVSFSSRKTPASKKHTIKVNGHTVYEGAQFGPGTDEKFDKYYLAPSFESATYKIPKEYIENGCIELEIGEPIFGVMLSEFWIKKAKN